MSSYYAQGSSRSGWSESSGQQDEVYADPLTSNDEDYYYDANDQNRLDLLKLILYDLNSAIAPRENRLMAIQAALDEFDHDDDVLHDEELDLRADHILLQKLAYAMCIDPSSDEVGYICSALEMVYRAGKTRLAQSFHEICDSLLPLIVEMIRPPLPGKNSTGKNKWSKMEEEQSLNTEEKRDLLDDENSPMNQPFMEPVDQSTAPRRFTYGDSDDSSAESVQIPSGTGEYFEQMNKAKQGANNASDADESAPQNHDVTQGLVLKPIELGKEAIVPAPSSMGMGGNVSTAALDAYKPVSTSSRRISEDSIRRDLETADEALRQLVSAESQESTQLMVPAKNNIGGALVAVTSPVGLTMGSQTGTNNLSRLTIETDLDQREQEGVLQLRGGGSGSVSSSEDANENVDQMNSTSNFVADDAPLFDPTALMFQSQNTIHEDMSVHGSFVYPESTDNPFSDANEYMHNVEETNNETMGERESEFDVGGGYSGDAPEIRPFGESVQVEDTYINASSEGAKINGSDQSDYKNNMNDGVFHDESGFSGNAPEIRPQNEPVHVTNEYYNDGPKVVEEVEDLNAEEAKDLNSNAFDVGGGFSGDAPEIRPLGDSMQATDLYEMGNNNVGDDSYLPQKRHSESTDNDGEIRQDSTFIDHSDSKRHSSLSEEDWDSRHQSEMSEWSDNDRRYSEYTDNVSSEQEYGQKLHIVEEEDSQDLAFHSSLIEEDIFQFREPHEMSKSVASEELFLSNQDDEFVCQLAIQKVLKILRYFSRVLSAMELLAQQPGLVDSLLYRMKKTAYSNDENEISARVDAIAVIVNLACAEENKILLVYHPGLLDAVINIANHDPIEEAREHAAIVLMNLVRYAVLLADFMYLLAQQH